ncbi:hypothetical protein ACIBEJ_02685 [Nonomuraea sp. NPDC050790]|uniref:hypothetical protein n=1 Tax=Nonomuraea sp. NPDC050790 TaxID=3364371 RepID=UPI00378CA30A
MADLKLSVAVRYHPSREPAAKALAAQCAELSPLLVPDPDPAGPPSPLRAAGRAWAACPDAATHHLVLQDDVVLAKDFAAHLKAAVRQRPAHGLALYVERDSPRNSYLFRRAAALGTPWAALSRFEHTPAPGFLLPAADARALAARLARVPDAFRDDEVVTAFCRERGVRVVALVPSLVDQGDLPGVAGDDGHGERHAAAFADHAGIDPSFWAAGAAEGVWPGLPYTLELRDSRCLIRFATGEPVDNPFGWYWHDWCDLLGVDADEVAEEWAAYMEETSLYAPVSVAGLVFPYAAALEVWAAGYILGFDVSSSRPGGGPPGPVSPVLRACVASWLDGGLSRRDEARLDFYGRVELADTCVAGFRAGCAATTLVATLE